MVALGNWTDKSHADQSRSLMPLRYHSAKYLQSETVKHAFRHSIQQLRRQLSCSWKQAASCGKMQYLPGTMQLA